MNCPRQLLDIVSLGRQEGLNILTVKTMTFPFCRVILSTLIFPSCTLAVSSKRARDAMITGRKIRV